MSEAGPEDWVERVRSARDGETVRLRPGRYREALLTGIRKSRDSPVTVDGRGATFGRDMTLERFGPIAKETARRAHLEGRYPGIYPIAEQAALRLERCAGLQFRNLEFVDSWPTAIHIKLCSHLGFEEVSVRGSTFAFYAVGDQTAFLTLLRCRWIQDTSMTRDLWSTIPWKEVHAKLDDDRVDEYNENRAFDGSFFLGNSIQGDIEIGYCAIEQAFNGVHLFNPDHVPALSRNVHVHHCRFEFIRDNAIEPEDVALNWWVHHNEIFNCHKWFSLELPVGGWFYFFRNRAWFDSLPGTEADEHRGGAVLKLFKKEARLLRYPGPVHLFNNSWYLRQPIVKEGAIARLWHHNNAIVFCQNAPGPRPAACRDASVLGELRGANPNSFTKRWRELGIHFVNDVVAHHDWPEFLRRCGYGDLDGIAGTPRFRDPKRGDFELEPGDTIARGRGRALEVPMPEPPHWRPDRPFNVGWYQDDEGVFARLQYRRMPDHLPELLPLEEDAGA